MTAEGGREPVTSEGINTGREMMEAASKASLTLLLPVAVMIIHMINTASSIKKGSGGMKGAG